MGHLLYNITENYVCIDKLSDNVMFVRKVNLTLFYDLV